MSGLPLRPRGCPTAASEARIAEQLKGFCATVQKITSTLDFKVSSPGWCYVLEGERVLSKGEFDAAIAAKPAICHSISGPPIRSGRRRGSRNISTATASNGRPTGAKPGPLCAAPARLNGGWGLAGWRRSELEDEHFHRGRRLGPASPAPPATDTLRLIGAYLP
jgi:hypothetical protein